LRKLQRAVDRSRGLGWWVVGLTGVVGAVACVAGIALVAHDESGGGTPAAAAKASARVTRHVQASVATSAPEARASAAAVKRRVNATAAPAKPRAATARTQMPNPVRIVIPAIGVDARVIPLGLNPDQTMQVPRNLADTGWFAPGPEPGEQGAAVIVGHLNSKQGPGVFASLSRLKPGRMIIVYLQGGSKVRFVARSMLRVAKSRFPTDLVYARTPQPTLRIITCAGALNPATGHHADNYIVFASLASASS
jgi:sortase (surface protein transpeptidase)